MHSASNPVRRAAGWIEDRLLVTIMLALLAFNGISIVARYVFNHALGELFEMMVLGGLAMYWLALGIAQTERAHLGVGTAVERLPARMRIVAEWLRLVMIAAFLSTVIYCGLTLALSQFRTGSVSGLLGIPLWVFCMFIPIGAALMLVRSVAQHLAKPGREDGPAL